MVILRLASIYCAAQQECIRCCRCCQGAHMLPCRRVKFSLSVPMAKQTVLSTRVGLQTCAAW